jgi:hypothetical protein
MASCVAQACDITLLAAAEVASPAGTAAPAADQHLIEDINTQSGTSLIVFRVYHLDDPHRSDLQLLHDLSFLVHLPRAGSSQQAA